MADELRDEQELALEFEKDCKLLESQVKEMEQRLDEAKANGFRNHNKFARVNQSTTFQMFLWEQFTKIRYIFREEFLRLFDICCIL